MTRMLRVFLPLALAGALAAQGSQRPVGGGCLNRSAPLLSGPISPGTVLQVDDPGCFLGQGGSAVMFLGVPLPRAAWVPVPLRSSRAGIENCLAVQLPALGLDVTAVMFPLRLQVPPDARLIGAMISVQVFCHECGFAGCFDLLTQGVELTFG